jgi:hypothetical protein
VISDHSAILTTLFLSSVQSVISLITCFSINICCDLMAVSITRFQAQFKESSRLWIPSIIIFAIILLSYIVPRDEDKGLVFYLVLVPVFVIYRYDSRIIIAYGLLLMMLAALLASVNTNFPANQLVVSSYWLLLVGVCCVFIELLRTRTKCA